MKRLVSHPRVEHADDERASGNSLIITLRQGWSFEPGIDNRVSGADTIAEALQMVRDAHAFAGPYEP